MREFKSLLSCENRRALVTGAAGYLGRTISKTLSEIGYDLILIDIHSDKLNQLALEIKSDYKVKIDFFDCDLENLYLVFPLLIGVGLDFSMLFSSGCGDKLKDLLNELSFKSLSIV